MRLLDLFCGAGGAARGYADAGFDVVGVDIEPQPEYPYTFHQGDATDLVWADWFTASDFDLIHASPPCQAFTAMGNRWKSPRWDDLVKPTRRLLKYIGLPYVIENVVGAPIRKDLYLTGSMFNLDVHRPRIFELGHWWTLSYPPPPRVPDPVAVYGKPDGRRLWTRSDGTEHRAWASIAEGQAALETPWITDAVQLAEAIPPAYTRYLGIQFINQHSRSSA